MTDQSLARQLVPLAKLIAMTSSGIATGAIWSVSFMGVPGMLGGSPETLAKTWKITYEKGKGSMPYFALAISSTFAFLASQSTTLPGRYPDQAFDPTSPFALFTGAAVAMPAIVPYTLLLMGPTIERLEKRLKDPKAVSESETRELIRTWSGMNYVRAGIVLAGTLMGGVAVLSS